MTTPRSLFSALLPHPPIIVPAVGGRRLEECRATVEACREVARRAVAHGPDRLVLISPHSPRRPDSFGAWTTPRLRGDLSRFGAPDAAVDLPSDPSLLRALGAADGAPVWEIAADGLDHGAVVPLWFLVEAGWDGPTTVFSLPAQESPADQLWAFGRALGSAAESLDGLTAFVASGDMSHRCLPGAPAGFHPRAASFDHALVDLVGKGRYREIPELDPELRRLAAEDTTESAMIATAAVGFLDRGGGVLSYEHPFGVGYLAAIFCDSRAGAGEGPPG